MDGTAGIAAQCRALRRCPVISASSRASITRIRSKSGMQSAPNITVTSRATKQRDAICSKKAIAPTCKARREWNSMSEAMTTAEKIADADAIEFKNGSYRSIAAW